MAVLRADKSHIHVSKRGLTNSIYGLHIIDFQYDTINSQTTLQQSATNSEKRYGLEIKLFHILDFKLKKITHISVPGESYGVSVVTSLDEIVRNVSRVYCTI